MYIMNDFNYIDGKLFCENVPIDVVAKQVGTPFYLYSSAALKRNFQDFDSGFEGQKHITCFAVKACSNLAILHILGKMGSGSDIVSGGELFRAMKAGIRPEKIIYSGVGKTRAEMREALYGGILMFNLESPQELDRLQEVAADVGAVPKVAFRINPDVDPETHAYISTGLAKNKFGIPINEALEQYVRARDMENIEVVGVSCHIGSQLTRVEPFVEALQKLKSFIETLGQQGVVVEYLDLGGGVGITYDDEQPPTPREYARAIREELDGLDCTLILEPGRVITGNAGILVSKVQYTKVNNGGEKEKRFVVVDAAMNDLTRPALYDAYHNVLPVMETDSAQELVDIVGPICETGDFLARDRMMPAVAQDDLLAVMSCGAYGFSMSSNYNSRPRIPEVLVKDERFQVIRYREEYEDLLRGESLSVME